MRACGKRRLVVAVMAIVCLMAPSLAIATVCNSSGCWDAILKEVKIARDRKIWFLTEGSTALGSLAGCRLGTLDHSGVLEKAVYVSSSDPEREEKYAMILLAYTTESRIHFDVVNDPDTGLCKAGLVSSHRPQALRPQISHRQPPRREPPSPTTKTDEEKNRE